MSTEKDSSSADTGSQTERGNSSALGVEIPALGASDRRPLNRKVLAAFIMLFVLITGATIYGVTRFANRNKAAIAAKPPPEEVIELPPERKRPPPSPQPLQSGGAIPLASEGIPGPAAGAPAAPGAAGTVVVPVSIEDKRTKSGGTLMGDDEALLGADGKRLSPEALAAANRRDLIRKRSQGTSESGGETLQTGGSGSGSSTSSGGGQSQRSGIQGGGAGSGRVDSVGGFPLGIGGGGGGSSAALSLGGSSGGAASLVGGGGNTKKGPIVARLLAGDRNFLLPRGTAIRCALDNRLISDVAGQVSCTVTNNVMSMTGTNRLVPKGSRLTGTYQGGGAVEGADRIAVTWDRLLTPSGIDIEISDPGTDALGGVGVPGTYDGHIVDKLTAAIWVSLLGDVFKYGLAVYGPTFQKETLDSAGRLTITKEPYNSVTVDTLSKIPAQLTARTLARPGTITVPQGEIINVMTTRDVDFNELRNAR